MSLQNSLREIKKFLKGRYKDNLAAILIFGSANTGSFVEGKSDIDTIILLKNRKNLNLEKEKNILLKKAKPIKWAIIHFETLSSYKRYIYGKGSWASWITVINGSRKLYQTKEFEKFRRQLMKKPIPKKRLFEYLKNKDRFELTRLKKLNGWSSTKWAFSHIRRKLQIMNYLKTRKLIFDYNQCVKNLSLENKEGLKKLSQDYKKRKIISRKEVIYYLNLAKELTKTIFRF